MGKSLVEARSSSSNRNSRESPDQDKQSWATRCEPQVSLEEVMENQPSVTMTLGLRVTDVQQALDFYRGIGFKPVMSTPDERGVPVSAR